MEKISQIIKSANIYYVIEAVMELQGDKIISYFTVGHISEVGVRFTSYKKALKELERISN